MSFALNLRRDKSKIAYDGDPPKDNAVEQILAWAIDHLTPEEIESLAEGLQKESRKIGPPFNPAMDSRTASFLKRFPEAKRIGHVGMAADARATSGVKSSSTNSFLSRFPEAARIAL